MKRDTVLTISLLFFSKVAGLVKNGNSWKAYASVPQLIRSGGYPVETHYVHTADGYILKLYRIPRGFKETNNVGEKKRAVVLVHGLFGSCDNFIILGPNKSLAFLLADAGYDVWIANLRGNLYTSHEKMTRKDPAFWDYSIDQHGNYDAPAFIDKILKETGLSRVLYVCHSMGCTTFFAMMSVHPEYNDKVVATVALAPGSYLDSTKSFSNYIGITLDLPNFLVKHGIKGLMVPPNILEIVTDYCISKQFNHELCMKIIFATFGENAEQAPWDMTKVILMRFQPASVQQIAHYMKISITGVITSWEDGLNGRVNPYNLSNVRTPVSIWYGENDKLTDKSGVLRLARELNETGALLSVRPVPGCPKFNHIDFLFAKDIVELLNKPLVAHINDLYKQFDKQ